MEQTAFGPVLKSVRSALGLSQAALALELASTQRHISFLETGRAQPSRSFLVRLCAELRLSPGQRASLFAASGYANPYRMRELDSRDVTATLDMIEHRVLGNWPFPAFLLDKSWNILRRNAMAQHLFGAFLPGTEPTNSPDNLLAVMLSPGFMGLIENWEDASAALFFRLQSAAARDATVAAIFDDARARGLFAHVEALLTDGRTVPVYIPVVIRPPGGASLRITSLLGQLATVQDEMVEGFDIELLIPEDAATEALLRQMGEGVDPTRGQR
ncbi:helix-turn-helix domain-containing protein [Pseudoruegeria sp. SHC-113]|uniref:helix-turn-helix domain-containing protein n=1 Tax=Pseudoruegeria sp. SHC-113 TaxID=2855439 RepID=UPI0021BADD2D|nr:helix-turn-helix transcriptional regulator [Pseudoruegeria sp. SHC-113]MCT8159304.1 helix-turn-helix transcriptional regulator [Pseudoruegeria sp. SHC-113]